MSCLTNALSQTEETQYKRAQSATIDAPSILTETIDVHHKDGWVTDGQCGWVAWIKLDTWGADGLTPLMPGISNNYVGI